MFDERKIIRLMAQAFVVVLALYVGAGTYYLRTHSLPSSHSGASSVPTVESVSLRPAQLTQVVLPTRDALWTPSPVPVPFTSTPSTPDTPTPTATPAGEYIVQAGDTLSSIANSHGLTTEDLLNANPGLRQSPDSLAQGQKVAIPTPSAATVTSAAAPPFTTAGKPTATAAEPSATDTPVPWVTYVVQDGDTLDDIAGRFGVTVDAIVRFNGLANPDGITPGQELTIPLQ